MSDKRLDFLAEEIDSNYDRETDNLPIFNNEDNLLEILREIFSIYEDLKGVIGSK
ncbi:hypothetical protein [Zobellia roscoffensis]|uniref:hypothetical protein n=1 Tax=Zobellia roscoffensis TaxID=2779508 RepID=UPI001889F77C|nr:hypothetical protein [Zobellia roscoffensis]